MIADYFTFLRVDGWLGAMMACWLATGAPGTLPRRALLVLGMFSAGQAVFGFGGFFHYDVLTFGGQTTAWLTLGKLASFGFLWEYSRLLRSAKLQRLASPITHAPLLAVLGFGVGALSFFTPSPAFAWVMPLALTILPALIGADACWQTARHATRRSDQRSAAATARYRVTVALVTFATAVGAGTMTQSDIAPAASAILSLLPWILCGIIARTSLRAADARQRLLPILAATLIGIGVAAPVFVSWEFARSDGPASAAHLDRARAWLIGGGLVVFFCQAGFLLAWRLALDEARALETARRDAASRAKTEFLAFLGHELRTPLQTILGRAELLPSADTPAARTAAIEAIAAEGKLMLRLINDGLDLGAIEAGRFELRPEPASLRALIASVTAPTEASARSKGLAFVVEVSPDLQDGIMVDEARLRQVLGNLLGNAVKFTTVGGVELRVERAAARADAAAETRVRFVVRDSGIGLPTEQIGRLFAPFTRLVSDRQAGLDGRGLGLALVKRLVEHMDGTVVAANRTDGAGAEFVVDLPLRRTESGPAAAEVAPSPQVTSPVSLRVLVVEDHPAAREVLTDFLHSLGHQPTSVGDAQAARAALAATAFDAVVLDLNLVSEDGTLLAREITGRLDGSARPRVIGCSADAFAQPRALAAGMDVFLAKPVSMADLQSVLHGTAARSDDLFSILRRADFNAASRANARAELAKLWVALRNAATNEDRAELRRLAHYLHNTALVLGDDQLERGAQNIGRAESQGDVRGARAEVEALLKSAGV